MQLQTAGGGGNLAKRLDSQTSMRERESFRGKDWEKLKDRKGVGEETKRKKEDLHYQ